MAAEKDSKAQGRAWHLATGLVHEGTLRSQFGETSEAIFLNSGYVYDSAEQAEARFKGDEEGFVYSRYANPTVAMFEARMCALEGAEAARGTASGMAAVDASLLSFLKAGDHLVSARALFGSCRYIVEDLLPRFGIETTLIDGRDLGAWEASDAAKHPRVVLRDAHQPGAGACRYRGGGSDRASSAGALRRRR